jgi:hypothetical protein
MTDGSQEVIRPRTKHPLSDRMRNGRPLRAGDMADIPGDIRPS